MLKVNLDNHRLETLIDINKLINSNYTNVNSLLTRILESATKLSSGEASSLLLLNSENNKLYFEIALGVKGKEIKRYSLNLGEGIAGWVAMHNTSLIVNDTDSDSRFNSEISKNIGFNTFSILAVPMRLKETCVGVLEIINKKNKQHFTDEDLQWLEIFATQAAIAIQNARSYQKVQQEIVSLQEEIQSSKGYHTFISESKKIKEVLDIAIRASKTDSSVLLLGESGVGKELFAEQIHLHSNRTNEPFIRINCAALPENLLESELFGHVKGAYTDAIRDRIGRFELADNGTIFLDEIAELPLNIQSKLLRVLQQHTIERVGSSLPIKLNVRIIAATNKDIEKLVSEEKFRTDLYYRLNVLPIYIPPLRERPSDIPPLLEFFLNKMKKKTKKKILGISEEAMDMLLSYSWPGNIRELENVIERAVVITQDPYLQGPDLFLNSISNKNNDNYQGKTLKESIKLFKKHFIARALEANGWKQTKTAKALCIQRTYLSKLIKELDIQENII